jgi:hypothetical protein
MDLVARLRLVNEATLQRATGGEIAVSLESFFEGNDDPGSIGCNLGDSRPTVRMFYQLLRDLRSNPSVQDMWVRICDFDDPQSWPYSDAVYVVSSLTKSEIEHALLPLRFDSVTEGWMYEKPPSVPEPREGCVPFSIWWD